MGAAEYNLGSESVVYEPLASTVGPDVDNDWPDLRLLHFNDVYHVESGSAEPIGGISRFQSVVNHYRNLRPATPGTEEKGVSVNGGPPSGYPELISLFSGDAFNPSLESSVTKGQHMVPVLNGIVGEKGKGAACVGNHDLDFGVMQFRHLRDQCKFPWLLANVLDPALGENIALGNCPKTAMIETSNGIKIGVIGLAEREWLDTINSLPPNLIYQSASETAKRLVPGLRAQGAEIIVALTHQREPNDNKLATKTPPGLIDIILGGHDHFHGHSLLNGTHVLRSGTDFKQLSYIEARRKPAGSTGWDFRIIRRDITRNIPEDPSTVKLVDRLTSNLKARLEKHVGYTAVPLDSRFTTVRMRESNMGNFVCDLMRHFYSTDCGLMAAGTIRGDQIYPPGVIRLKDILNCFPFEDPVVVLRLTGQAILLALENSICLFPALEGRFLQVSNITFAFDPTRPSGSRIVWAKINGQDLDLKHSYTVATRGYMARGKDGFTSLLAISEGGTAEEVISEENGILISMVLRQYFMSLKVLGRWARWSPSLHRHWGGVHEQLHTDGRVKIPAGPKMGIKHGRTGSMKVGNEDGKVDPDREMVDIDSDDESIIEGSSDSTVSTGLSVLALSQGHSTKGRDREMHLSRVYMRRWMARAGIEREHADVIDSDEHSGKWAVPHWTHGIAPKVEGRILNLSDKGDKEKQNGKVSDKHIL